jgi:hypothetical protein
MKTLRMALAAAALLALAGCDSPAFHQNWPGGSDYQPHAVWQRGGGDGDHDHDRYERQRADLARERACRHDPDDCWR